MGGSSFPDFLPSDSSRSRSRFSDGRSASDWSNAAACAGRPGSVSQVWLLNLAEQSSRRWSMSAPVLGPSSLLTDHHNAAAAGTGLRADTVAVVSIAQMQLLTVLFSRGTARRSAFPSFHDNKAPMPANFLSALACVVRVLFRFDTVAPDNQRRCLLEGRMWSKCFLL